MQRLHYANQACKYTRAASQVGLSSNVVVVPQALLCFMFQQPAEVGMVDNKSIACEGHI